MKYDEKAQLIEDLVAAVRFSAPNHPLLEKWDTSGGTSSLPNEVWQKLARDEIEDHNIGHELDMTEDEIDRAARIYLRDHDDSDLIHESVEQALEGRDE